MDEIELARVVDERDASLRDDCANNPELTPDTYAGLFWDYRMTEAEAAIAQTELHRRGWVHFTIIGAKDDDRADTVIGLTSGNDDG